MKLYIPRLGDELKLTKDWEFKLYREHRNNLFSLVNSKIENNNRGDYKHAILPENTILKVDRIYIRAGSENYDSVTFRISDCPASPAYNKKRFWVKLNDANEIEFVPVVNSPTVKMHWMNWLPQRHNTILRKTDPDLRDPWFGYSHSLTLKLNDELRFEITMKVIKYDATDENWLKFSLDKRFHTSIVNRKCEPIINVKDYIKNYYSSFNKPSVDDLTIVEYIYTLLDHKTQKTYEFSTINSAKSKARSIIKEESQNGK